MTMHHIADKLTERYLLKMINAECKIIFEKQFESLFEAYSCEPEETGKNTTLGATFDMMESMAFITINDFLKDMKKNTWIKKVNYSSESLCDVAEGLLDMFLDYIEIKPYIQSFFSEEQYEKQKELFAKGIIDEEGDFIRSR